MVGRTMRMMYGPKTDTNAIDSAMKNPLPMYSTNTTVHLYGRNGEESIPIHMKMMLYQESNEIKGVKLVLNYPIQRHEAQEIENEEITRTKREYAENNKMKK
jgi:hypothetical protein